MESRGVQKINGALVLQRRIHRGGHSVGVGYWLKKKWYHWNSRPTACTVTQNNTGQTEMALFLSHWTMWREMAGTSLLVWHHKGIQGPRLLTSYCSADPRVTLPGSLTINGWKLPSVNTCVLSSLLCQTPLPLYLVTTTSFLFLQNIQWISMLTGSTTDWFKCSTCQIICG